MTMRSVGEDLICDSVTRTCEDAFNNCGFAATPATDPAIPVLLA